MKNQKLVGITLAAAVALSTLSCNRDKFLDVNTTPNSPTVVTMPLLFTSTVIYSGFVATNDLGRAAALFIQHKAGLANQMADYDRYNIRGSFDNQWNGELYGGTLINSQTLIDLAVAKNSPAYGGIAKLLKAYNFSVATDMYGDVPYSQALKGSANTHPRYDKQEDIYKGNATLGIQGLIDLVKEGLADLEKPSTLKPGTGDDPVYGKTANNIAQWKKMGNTLLLKFANTISKKEPALAASLINQAAAGAFASNADDFEVPFGSGSGNQNPLYSFNFVNRPNDQMLSQRLLDSMKVRNDPRLPVYFTTTPTPAGAVNPTGTVTTVGVFTGYQNGGTASGLTIPLIANRSRYNVFIRGNSGEAPARLLTNVQRLFILAEAALTLPGITVAGTAQSLYQDAIRASMIKAGITDAAVTAYFAANPKIATLGGTTEQKRNQIITEKWISWVGNGLEAYNDFRRTGYPRLAPVLNPAGDDGILPQRFALPLSELTANAGAENQDVNVRTSVPVWWATK
ncbi:MAG: SusD/RagB family nutrient-binding outer membrane lipoprotein [Hymenobacter sp.]